MMGGLQGIVLRFKFHQNWFGGFGAVGGRYLPFRTDLAIGLYNSLYYRTSRDTENGTLGNTVGGIQVLQ